MNRREFLSGLILGVGGGAAGVVLGLGSGRALGSAAPGPHCRTRLPGESAAARSGDLCYQGTHILTYGALRDVAAAYNRGRSPRVVVRGGGCDDGIAAVRQRLAELGGMCCPVEGSRAAGMPWLAVARDIKVAVVHRDNPVQRIGLEELRAIARGTIRRWSELDGTDRSIALVVRKHCPDYFEPVRQLLLGKEPLWSERALFVNTDQQIVDSAARFAGSLGLVSWVFARPFVEQKRLKVLAVDEVAPTVAAVRAGRYRLVGPLNIVFARWRGEAMAPFFDFLYGREGQAIVARQLVPLSAEEAGYRPARFI